MPGTAMMAVEGVLGVSDEFTITMMPSDEGRALYEGLSHVYRMVLVTSEPDESRVEHWLRSQGIQEYAQVLTPAPGWSGEPIDARAAQLRGLRASRTAVGLVVDTSPLVVVHAMSVGVTGLLFGPPRPAPGRVDLGKRRVRDWSAIEGELDMQRGLRETTP